jgi:hypothetical protein
MLHKGEEYVTNTLPKHFWKQIIILRKNIIFQIGELM